MEPASSRTLCLVLNLLNLDGNSKGLAYLKSEHHTQLSSPLLFLLWFRLKLCSPRENLTSVLLIFGFLVQFSLQGGAFFLSLFSLLH